MELSVDDKTSNCINYPTETFKSYDQCDQEYIRKELPEGLIPFWSIHCENITLASNKFSWNGSKEEFKLLLNKFGKLKNEAKNNELSRITTDKYIYNDFVIDGFISGYYEADCRVPCKKTMIEISTGQISLNSKQNYSQIFMAFDQKVKIKAIKVDKFNIFGAFNFLGSNLGLLPGMGLYQLLEWSMLIIISFRELIKRREL